MHAYIYIHVKNARNGKKEREKIKEEAGQEGEKMTGS